MGVDPQTQCTIQRKAPRTNYLHHRRAPSDEVVMHNLAIAQNWNKFFVHSKHSGPTGRDKKRTPQTQTILSEPARLQQQQQQQLGKGTDARPRRDECSKTLINYSFCSISFKMAKSPSIQRNCVQFVQNTFQLQLAFFTSLAFCVNHT